MFSSFSFSFFIFLFVFFNNFISEAVAFAANEEGTLRPPSRILQMDPLVGLPYVVDPRQGGAQAAISPESWKINPEAGRHARGVVFNLKRKKKKQRPSEGAAEGSGTLASPVKSPTGETLGVGGVMLNRRKRGQTVGGLIRSESDSRLRASNSVAGGTLDPAVTPRQRCNSTAEILFRRVGSDTMSSPAGSHIGSSPLSPAASGWSGRPNSPVGEEDSSLFAGVILSPLSPAREEIKRTLEAAVQSYAQLHEVGSPTGEVPKKKHFPGAAQSSELQSDNNSDVLEITDTSLPPYHGVCGLEMVVLGSDGEELVRYIGTGFLWNSPHGVVVVTAAHNVFYHKYGGGPSYVLVYPAVNGREGIPISAKTFIVHQGYVDEKDREKAKSKDIGVIYLEFDPAVYAELEEPVPPNLDRLSEFCLPLRVFEEAALQDQTLTVIGYPSMVHTRDSEYMMLSGQRMFARKGIVRRIADGRVYHGAGTYKGDSGSPMIPDILTPSAVCGVHAYGEDPINGNSGTLFSIDIYDRLHWWAANPPNIPPVS